jgi:hypothetical protein
MQKNYYHSDINLLSREKRLSEKKVIHDPSAKSINVSRAERSKLRAKRSNIDE